MGYFVLLQNGYTIVRGLGKEFGGKIFCFIEKKFNLPISECD